MGSNSRSTARNKVNNDPVDELKRRSRRRLVGSIALFLAAIIIVPALVENEPEQTSSEVELVVPERPSAESPPVTAKADTASPSSPLINNGATTVVPPAEAEIEAPTGVPQVEPPAPKVESKQAEPKPSPPVEPKPVPKPEAKVETKPETKPQPKPESKPAADDPIADFAKAKDEQYWVQVAAVSDKARADALGRELGAKGFSARVEPTNSANGTIYRVRVGPLAGQGKADDMKARLSAAGYSAGRVVK